MRVPVAFQYYLHRHLPISAQRVVNWFAEAQPDQARARTALLPTPGLVEFVDLGGGPVRAMEVMGDRLYAVSDGSVYRITPQGSATFIGSVTPGKKPLSTANNGTQVVIVDPADGLGWTCTATTNVQPITDPDFLPAAFVTVSDRYGVFVRKNSQQIFLSELADLTQYDALDFASAEGSPDNLVCVRRVGSQIWLFGERTIEMWSNVGAADFPFLRVSGAFVDRGCAAPFSAAVGFNTVFWLGDDRVVYRAEGFAPIRISTHALEQAIGGFESVADAIGWCYSQDGHQFYVLTFPSEGYTFVYDTATSVWHERETEGYPHYRAWIGTMFAGAPMAGDSKTGQIWRLDPYEDRDGGVLINRLAAGVPLHAEGKRVRYAQALVECETGIGQHFSDLPMMRLDWSVDGGRTWSSPMVAPLGPLGQYRRRAVFRRLGTSAERVFRVQVGDAERPALMHMALDVEIEEV